MSNMPTIRAPAERPARTYGRGVLLSVLECEDLLTRLRVLPDGRFIPETVDWDAYWKPVRDLGNPKIETSLNALYSAWRNYIAFRFASGLRKEFCFRYFRLLDAVLASLTEVPTEGSSQALQAVLGFECFQVTSARNSADVLGAGTCTLRNPCYLLAKLKEPRALDDPRFLPVITAPNLERIEIFYHYRQYRLAPDSMSLLVYLAVTPVKRPASFKLINSLISGVSNYIDPRTRRRAQRLCVGILWPIIQARTPTAGKDFGLELIDVGAGSGSLSSCLCHQVRALCKSSGINPKFRVFFVDLEPGEPARFFRAADMRWRVDSLMFLGNDYRAWLGGSHPAPLARGLRIALVSKLFNNLSNFSVRCVSSEELSSAAGHKMSSGSGGEHLPANCLAPGGPGEQALIIAPARAELRDGRAFAQLSLSGYYRGIYILSSQRCGWPEEDGTFLPVRLFNPDSLVTVDGNSVLARLAENCDYVLIEDADLTPKHLVEHLRSFSLRSITALDVTKALKLTGNYAYVLWSRATTAAPDLSGEPIWSE